MARPIYEGASLMITRRVHGREFRLRPDRRVNQIILYVVAVVARRTGILLHSVVAMSNHWHVCLTDPEGRVCEFTRDCHAFIARAVNAAYGDFESLWSSEQTSHVACVEPNDLVRKMAYTMANPVEAGLVKYGKSWPGVRVCWPAGPKTVRRPKKLFRDESKGGIWPATVDDELRAMIGGVIEERERGFRTEAARAGKTFMGRRAILEQPRRARPTSREPRFKMSPRVACRNKWRRIERIRRDREWLVVYTAARDRWVGGDREVEFPHGTYKMRVVHRARCVPPPL